MKHRFSKALLLLGVLTSTMTSSSYAQDLVRGADVSWLTEMEANGKKFYNHDANTPEDCMDILSDLGCNAIRLRVWVNPTNGYNGIEDVLAKAKRAKAHGQLLMIDFHYSDTFADPAKQNRPAAWSNYTVDELCSAIATHTTDVLNTLKDNNINVTWVQVGNETTDGMFYPTGQLSKNGADNYAKFFNAGATAAKAVFPDCKIVLHIDAGADNTKSVWSLDKAKNAGVEWDITGLSFYFAWDDTNWDTKADNCVNNVTQLVSRYSKPVMLSELGINTYKEAPQYAGFFTWSPVDTHITSLRDRLEAIDGFNGSFYWEPESYDWQNYGMGGFRNGWPLEFLKNYYAGTPSAGIDDVYDSGKSVSKTAKGTYNLAGQKVKADYKGIVIKDGRKKFNK